MNIIEKNINDIIPYENNPRNNENAVDKVAASIKEFGFKVPIVIDVNNIIVAGHTRLKAAQRLNMTTVPCVVADDLTEKQIKAFRLADNKVSEFSTWDFDLLASELSDMDMDIDMSDFGFDLDNLDIESPADVEEAEGGEGTPYTSKIEGLQYEPSAEKPLLSDLFDKQKTNELIDKIKAANVSDEEKDFLITAASRHTVFDYAKIADYYVHSDVEMQSLMEQSALVIIDFEDAVKNGYARLSDEISAMYMEDTES